jgi:erythromycin esterase
MIRGGAASWNVRDYHMADTLQRLMDHHDRRWGDGQPPKAIVWEHNTHIGDSRYTDMARGGMVNVGQIARERYGDETLLVGFGSYEGSVIAAESWGAPMAQMRVPPAQAESWEQVLHAAGPSDRLLLLEELAEVEPANEWRGHRAIGVVYHPDYEHGNYVPTQMTRRYDAFIYLDRTAALHPLHIKPDGAEIPATYPWGF